MISLEKRIALTQRMDITLDGHKAKILGYKNEFALVANTKGQRVEFAWETAERIANSHKAFKS